MFTVIKLVFVHSPTTQTAPVPTVASLQYNRTVIGLKKMVLAFSWWLALVKPHQLQPIIILFLFRPMVQRSKTIVALFHQGNRHRPAVCMLLEDQAYPVAPLITTI